MYRAFEERELIRIDGILTFFHFRFATGYVFPGERHPFWELVYVLSGQVDIGADDEVFMLNAGDMIFHRPDEFHSIWANYAHAPDLIVVSFRSDSEAMRAFEKRRMHAGEEQRALMTALLEEAGKLFRSPLDEGEKQINPSHPGGAYTLRLILTRLLMSALDGGEAYAISGPAVGAPDPDTARLLDEVVAYMKENLRGGLRFEDLCRRMGMSGTAVKQLFRSRLNTSPMAYYEQVRMGAARQLLRQSGGNIAETAYALGFSSPSYFSSRFRLVNGISPRGYLKEFEQKRRP